MIFDYVSVIIDISTLFEGIERSVNMARYIRLWSFKTPVERAVAYATLVVGGYPKEFYPHAEDENLLVQKLVDPQFDEFLANLIRQHGGELVYVPP